MPDSSPLVSVIIVSYKHSQFVEECLDSLLAQTYTKWELIIADDASPDNSVDVIETWLSKNQVSARKIFHAKNIGLCNTLNECIEQSGGKYLKLFAADDIMLPELLEKSVLALERLGPTYGLAYSKAQYIDETGVVGDELYRLPTYPDGEVYNNLMRGNFIPALSVLLQADAIKKMGVFTLEFMLEDYDYWIRLSSQYKFAFIDEVLGLYRIHSSNISKSIDLDEEVLRIQMHYDKEGRFRGQIENKVRDFYYLSRHTPKLIKKYAAYPFRNKWLSTSLNNGLPYKIFRIVDKLFFLRHKSA